MPTATISVRTVQKGITFWLAEEFPDSPRFTEDVAHPGRIDGRWGPMTHDALRDYVVFNRPGHLDAARVLAPLRSTPARATEIELESYFVSRLNTHALLYRPSRRGSSRQPTTGGTDQTFNPSPEGSNSLPTTDRPERRSSAGPLLGGLAIAGAVALIGAVMVSRSRAAKRRRFEDDDLDFDEQGGFDEDDEFFDDDELVPA